MSAGFKLCGLDSSHFPQRGDLTSEVDQSAHCVGNSVADLCLYSAWQLDDERLADGGMVGGAIASFNQSGYGLAFIRRNRNTLHHPSLVFNLHGCMWLTGVEYKIDMAEAEQKLGPYTLLSKIGRGAFGVVWLAEKRSSIATTPRVGVDY